MTIPTPASAPSPGDSDQLLVDRTVAGDQKAYELLVIKYQRRIERLIGRMVRDWRRSGRPPVRGVAVRALAESVRPARH